MKRADWVKLGIETTGLLSVGVGLWWIYPPATLIVLGGLIVGVSWMSTLRGK